MEITLLRATLHPLKFSRMYLVIACQPAHLRPHWRAVDMTLKVRWHGSLIKPFPSQRLKAIIPPCVRWEVVSCLRRVMGIMATMASMERLWVGGMARRRRAQVPIVFVGISLLGNVGGRTVASGELDCCCCFSTIC